jgi:hypothetical protein
MIRVIFVFIWVFYKLVFLIDCLGNRRNDICGSGKNSVFPRGSLLVEVYKLLFGVLIILIALSEYLGYCTLIECCRIYNKSRCCPKWWQRILF